MRTIEAHYDGKRIVLPDNAGGIKPGKVLVIVDDVPGPSELRKKPTSIFDFIGKAENPVSDAEIDARVAALRDDRESR